MDLFLERARREQTNGAFPIHEIKKEKGRANGVKNEGVTTFDHHSAGQIPIPSPRRAGLVNEIELYTALPSCHTVPSPLSLVTFSLLYKPLCLTAVIPISALLPREEIFSSNQISSFRCTG